MFRAFWFLLMLAAVSLGAALLADNPGQMSMQWLGYKIEASIGILFARLLWIWRMYDRSCNESLGEMADRVYRAGRQLLLEYEKHHKSI